MRSSSQAPHPRSLQHGTPVQVDNWQAMHGA